MKTIKEGRAERAVVWLTIKWGEVKPLPGRTWDECITEINGHPVLWFNTTDGSTHLHWI